MRGAWPAAAAAPALIHDGMEDEGVGEGGEGGEGDDVVFGAKDQGAEVEAGADVADELEDNEGDDEDGGRGAVVVIGAVVDGAAVVAGARQAAAEAELQ